MPNEVAPEAPPTNCPAASNGASAASGKGAASNGAPSVATSPAGGSSPKSGPDAAGSSTASTATKQKKTVTFRNVLETSDDKSVVKRFYNPDIRIPIVSIMKKDSLNRPLNYSRGGECIVRPSILSKILNKNSNIDKLNSLKFRSAPANSSSSSSQESGSSPNVFGLSRAFGAPMDEDDEGGVTFRRQESPEDHNNVEDEEMEEDVSTINLNLRLSKRYKLLCIGFRQLVLLICWTNVLYVKLGRYSPFVEIFTFGAFILG